MSRPSDESMPQAVKDTVERTKEPIIDMSRTQVLEAIFEITFSLLRPPPWARPDESREDFEYGGRVSRKQGETREG